MSGSVRLVEKVTVDGSLIVFDVVWVYCGYGITSSSTGVSHAVSSKTVMETSAKGLLNRFILGGLLSSGVNIRNNMQNG